MVRPSTRSRRRRQPSRAGAAAVLAAVTLGTPFLAVPAQAATSTINCDTVSRSSSEWTTCRSLVGTAECVWDNRNGTYTLAVGFTNPSSSDLNARIPVNGVGLNNSFSARGGFASDPAHLDTFPPGTYRTAFTVTWSPRNSRDPVTWELMDRELSWDRRYTECATKPVPVVGSAGGLLMGLLGLIALLAVSSSGRGRLVTAARRLTREDRSEHDAA